jgi:hypothetical protein
LVLYGTLKIILTSINTSLLLNGWYLAARDVWIEEWDERNANPASNVKVDFIRQTARRTHPRHVWRRRTKWKQGLTGTTFSTDRNIPRQLRGEAPER